LILTDLPVDSRALCDLFEPSTSLQSGTNVRGPPTSAP
jgi:hypothetical protein